MEDVLDVYKRPYDEKQPVVCMDETNKQQIKEIDDLPTKIIEVAEWGGQLKLKMMSAKQRMEFERLTSKTKEPIENIILMVIYSCINEDGSLFFSLDDKEFLQSKSSDVLLRIFQEAVSLSVMSNVGIEDKAKNS